MRFTPVPRRHALPTAKCSSERVGVFIAKKVSGLVQLKNRIAQIIASHLMPGFIENTLETGACFLQPSLQCPWARVKVARDILHIRSLSRQPLLDRSPGQFDKAVLAAMLLEFLLELRRKHFQQLSIPRDEGTCSID